MIPHLLMILILTAKGQICRISIPNSGGASTRPISFLSPGVSLEKVPGHSYCNSTYGCSYCDGPAGCETECCARQDCLAWGWAIAGSVHTACGGQTCEIFTLSVGTGGAWLTETANATVYNGYNYAGFIYNSTQMKNGCCRGSAS